MGPTLPKNTVDLWLWRLDQDHWDCHAEALCPEEQERAARFRGESLQSRYRRCRGVLRFILGQYLNQPPKSLAFTYNTYGKPALTRDESQLHFNVSHCDDLALLAITSRAVGVDIESYDRPNTKTTTLLDMVCHPEEKQALIALPAAEQETAFYRLWTQKEAYCKALGEGLQKTLPAIRFIPARTWFVVDDAEASDAQAFFVHTAPAPCGYLASVCTTFSNPLFRTGSIGPNGLAI